MACYVKNNIKYVIFNDTVKNYIFKGLAETMIMAERKAQICPMHIAISAHFWGQSTTGSGQYLHRLVETFGHSYPNVDLTLIADSEAARRAPPPDGVRWIVAHTPFDRNKNLAKLWFEQVAAPRTAQRVGADLFHVPYFAPPFSRALPVVVTIHDLIPMILPAYRGRALVRAYTTLVARAARSAEYILADSDASRRDILRLLAVEPERVQTVYLAAEERFRPQAPTAMAEIRQRLNLPEQFALYLGGFDIRKNIPCLLQAVANSKGTWPLVIAGKLPRHDSPFRPDPRRLVQELGIAERVHFTGWIEEEDKAALLATASLFVFPSAYEGFGLPILEAMACGTATLTTDVSSLPELAGDAAALVPPNDVKALTTAMDYLMEADEARTALAARGPVRAAAFSWLRCAAETFAAYQLVLSKVSQ